MELHERGVGGRWIEGAQVAFGAEQADLFGQIQDEVAAIVDASKRPRATPTPPHRLSHHERNEPESPLSVIGKL